MRTRLLGLALAAACCELAPTVGALADSAQVTATALFDEGRKLMGEKRYAEACPKLAESQRLAPSGGTLMNLADCYEHTGQTASAWSTWKEVASRANAAGKAAVEKTAVTRAATLEPALARLTIAVAPGSDVPGLEVMRDGMAVGHAEFGLALPVDPGPHRIDAAAPKRKPLSTSVDVVAKQTDARVTIELASEEEPPPPTIALAPAPPPPAIAVPRAAPPPASGPLPIQHGSTQRTLGWVGLGVGAAGVAVGAIFGAMAISKANEATADGCAGATCAGSKASDGVSATNTAETDATWADVGLIVGGVVAAAGAVLVFTAPGGRGVHVMPAVGRSSVGLALGGNW
jgi:hypothetical protein